MAKAKIVVKGDSALIKALEQQGQDLEKLCCEAIELSAKNATNRYHSFINQHKLTGITESAIVENPKAELNGSKITLQSGFDISKGGMPAIWLDRGTPKQKPTRFIQSIKNSQPVKGAIGFVLGQAWRKG